MYRRCFSSLPSRSVQADDTEPQHHNIESEEWNAKEARRVTFARRCRYIDTVPQFRAQILLLSRVNHGNVMRKQSGWRRQCLGDKRRRDSGWLLCSIVRTHHLLGCWAVCRLSIVRLATFSWTWLLLAVRCFSDYWFDIFGDSFKASFGFIFFVLLWWLVNLAFECVSTGQASCCRYKVCNREHEVEDGRADFLVNIFSTHTGPKECNINEHEDFFQCGVVL